MPSFPRFPVSLALLLLGATSCEQRRVSVPALPPPAPSQPAPPHASPAAQTPATTRASSAPAATTSVPASPATGSEAKPSNRYQVNKPPQPAKKAARSGTAAPSPAASAPAPAASGPAAASAPAAPESPAPAPKLADVLTSDEQKQYNASIDQSLAHAQTSLDQIKEHRLTADQSDQVEQIANFMKQARTARASDLAGAKSLAERAEVLAKDLAAALH